MARSLMPFPWPGMERTASPDSMSNMRICFGFSPAMHSSGLCVIESFVQTTLLTEESTWSSFSKCSEIVS